MRIPSCAKSRYPEDPNIQISVCLLMGVTDCVLQYFVKIFRLTSGGAVRILIGRMPLQFFLYPSGRDQGVGVEISTSGA